MAVVRIADRATGGVKSTEEILAEKPISLSKSLARAGQGEVGGGGLFSGTTGGALASPAPAIKIETKPPPIRQTQSVEATRPVVEEKLAASGTKKTSFSVAGPIAQRAIVGRVLPAYPAWCQQQGISGTVTIRLWVYPDGSIKESMLIEISSGYPDLDQSVINALKRWRFAPLPASVVQETQWGMITFHFVLS